MIRTRSTSFRLAVVGAACVVLLAGCQTPSTGLSAASAVKTMDVNGARLAYVEQGRGEPVVFVRGAVADYRIWDRQRAALAADGYRAIAHTQRYFGTAPWRPECFTNQTRQITGIALMNVCDPVSSISVRLVAPRHNG